MKISRKTLVTAITFLLIGIIGTSIAWVYAQPSTPFTISEGVYPSAYSYSFKREGATYYAKNAYGQVFEETNASTLISNVINSRLPQGDALTMHGLITAPYGTLFFSDDDFVVDPQINIPLGSRIKMLGQGFTSQPITFADLAGGTRIISDDPNGLLYLNNTGTLKNGTYLTQNVGTSFHMEGFELYQRAVLGGAGYESIFLSGMSQGVLRNIYLGNHRTQANYSQGTGFKQETQGWSDRLLWENVHSYGFTIGAYLDTDHHTLIGCGFGGSQLALKFGLSSHVHYYDTHFFGTDKIMDTVAYASSFGVFPNVVFDGVYIESAGMTSPAFSDAISNMSASGKIILKKVYVASGQANIWTWTRKERYEFHNVIASTNSPAYPTATTPAVPATTVSLRNPNPNVCDVYITGGTVTQIAINGVNTGLTNGRFTLFGRDNITLTYSSVPSWVWRNYDVTYP